ncbi:hypothetical protein [Burkholderia pyrrocinia]|uniref:hypothetical protein n=1 Tax=Burkholderia pyrrocinia TaxID=60550 RepID=UPI0012603AF9|nr:hypothetical protein [Burkholderia pyrrocinia]
MNTRYIFGFAGIFILAIPLLVVAKELPFSGGWSSTEMIAGQRKLYSTFRIELAEDESGNIRGKYCFITQSGNRIDCAPDGELNISGRAGGDGNTVAVKFHSFFGAVGGLAKITTDGDWLIWDVIKTPEGGDYYGPLRAKMHKDSSVESHSGEKEVVKNKAFLYDTPSHSLAAHVYVVKGDRVKLLSVSPDLRFWKIEFISRNKRHYIKWIDCRDIDFCAG